MICAEPSTKAVIGLDRGTTDLVLLEQLVLDWIAESISEHDEIATHIIDGHYVASISVAAKKELQALKAASAFGFIVSGIGEVETVDPIAMTPEPTEVTPTTRARQAAMAHHKREGGRLIRFSGCDMTGLNEMTVSQLLATTSIDEVVPLGADLTDAAVVVTNGFVRPTFRGGRTTLVVTPLDDNRFAPFETEHPHQCCGGHH